jgi:hypothetical protein
MIEGSRSGFPVPLTNGSGSGRPENIRILGIRIRIHNTAFSGRMALLVTLFLVLVNIFNSVTANAPKVSTEAYSCHPQYYSAQHRKV